jgi:hypothetical protein
LIAVYKLQFEKGEDMKAQYFDTVEAYANALAGVPAGDLLRLDDVGDLPAEGKKHRFMLTRGKQHKTGRSWRTRTDAGSCPGSCPFRGRCYGNYGPVMWHWQDLDNWDLDSDADKLNWRAALKLAKACAGKIAWTYTHWDRKRYGATLKRATQLGLTVNVSTESPQDAVNAFRAGFPTALVCHPDQRKSLQLAPDVKGVVCPSFTAGLTCDACGGKKGPLCARADRNYVVLFPSHGPGGKKLWREVIAPLWGEHTTKER